MGRSRSARFHGQHQKHMRIHHRGEEKEGVCVGGGCLQMANRPFTHTVRISASGDIKEKQSSSICLVSLTSSQGSKPPPTKASLKFDYYCLTTLAPPSANHLAGGRSVAANGNKARKHLERRRRQRENRNQIRDSRKPYFYVYRVYNLIYLLCIVLIKYIKKEKKLKHHDHLLTEDLSFCSLALVS